jgi:biopolymer transport protein ExbD
MNFTPPARRKRARLLTLELTPMIDVIFLLLIYFFLSTTYMPPESELTPALEAERVDGGRGADLQPQIIEVARFAGKPGFAIGERVMFDRDALLAVLEQLPTEGGVFVRGADDVTTSWALAAIQASRDAGFTKVTYVPVTEVGE